MRGVSPSIVCLCANVFAICELMRLTNDLCSQKTKQKMLLLQGQQSGETEPALSAFFGLLFYKTPSDSTQLLAPQPTKTPLKIHT